jgi:23S rRNA (guanosine2251-2'-O)-methyltransferase
LAEWIYGRNAVYEVLRAHRREADQLRIASKLQPSKRLETIKNYAKEQKIPIEIVEKSSLNKLANGHQGVALRVAAYPYSDIGQMLSLAKERGENPFLLLLDTLQDPQNLGSLLRSAEAVGVHGVILPHRHTATVTPAVVNVSSGASEHLLISQQNLAQAINLLKDENVWIIGLDGSNETPLLDQAKLTGSLAIVVGSEGEGMRKLVRESCDLLVRIPMHGQIESLNAAVAGSVVLYLASQGRKASSTH